MKINEFYKKIIESICSFRILQVLYSLLADDRFCSRNKASSKALMHSTFSWTGRETLKTAQRYYFLPWATPRN